MTRSRCSFASSSTPHSIAWMAGGWSLTTRDIGIEMPKEDLSPEAIDEELEAIADILSATRYQNAMAGVMAPLGF